MLIENSGPKIGTQDIAQIEAELGAALPDCYRRFLLQYNGGSPTPDTIDVPGAADSPTDVQVFFGIGRSVESSGLASNLALVRERCPNLHVLPVACDSGGNLFGLSIDHGTASKVIYCDLDDPDCATYEVAASFDEFIAKMRAFEK
jgi:cell wall assembly regulator SMI1